MTQYSGPRNASSAPDPADPVWQELDQLRRENKKLKELLTISQRAGASAQTRGAFGGGVQALPTEAVTEALAHGKAVAHPTHERYRVLRRVAAGGMAEIFLAEAESIQGFPKQVALKRILPRLTSEKRFLDMFLDEARLSLQLQHSRIVQVFDIGRADNAYFIVMEFVDGIDLRTLLSWRFRSGVPAPVQLCLHIAQEVCAALAYAHELSHPKSGKPLGIVHRDVTLANVLLSKQGEVKVLDFGVAKANSQTELTDPGIIKGKLGYLAPETAYGHKVDHRVDLFAVGIMLYESLAGKRLFRAKNEYDTLKMVRAAHVPNLCALNDEVDEELDALVHRALAAKPDQRYQTAADLAEALACYRSSRQLKVTARDLATFVKQCILDRENWTNQGLVPSDVDDALQDEVERFASIIYDPDSSEIDLLASHSGPHPPLIPDLTVEFSLADALKECTGPGPEPDSAEHTFILERTPSRAVSCAEEPEERPPINRQDPTLESIASFKREQLRGFWRIGVGITVICLIAASILAFT